MQAHLGAKSRLQDSTYETEVELGRGHRRKRAKKHSSDDSDEPVTVKKIPKPKRLPVNQQSKETEISFKTLGSNTKVLSFKKNSKSVTVTRKDKGSKCTNLDELREKLKRKQEINEKNFKSSFVEPVNKHAAGPSSSKDIEHSNLSDSEFQEENNLHLSSESVVGSRSPSGDVLQDLSLGLDNSVPEVIGLETGSDLLQGNQESGAISLPVSSPRITHTLFCKPSTSFERTNSHHSGKAFDSSFINYVVTVISY